MNHAADNSVSSKFKFILATIILIILSKHLISEEFTEGGGGLKPRGSLLSFTPPPWFLITLPYINLAILHALFYFLSYYPATILHSVKLPKKLGLGFKF